MPRSSPSSRARRASPPDTDTDTDDGASSAAFFGGATVEAYYGTACASCHGDDRSGDFGPSLLAEDLTENDAFYVGKLATGSMAREAPGLTSEEISALVAFLRTGEGAAAGSTAPSDSTPGGAIVGLVAGLTPVDFYGENCARCHADDLSGDDGPSLYPEDLTESPSFYFDKLASGSMKRHAGELTPGEVDALVAFLLGSEDGGGSASEPADDPGPPLTQELLFGQELYTESCAGCHGADGLDIDRAPLGLNDWITNTSPEGLLLRINRGKTSQGMPAFGIDYGGWLTPEQVESLAIYLREMSR